MKIELASNLKLPLEVVTETLAVIAKRRMGKSYKARKFVEQLFAAGQQCVVVDPKGDWWGLRFAADGKNPGLPIIILGGEHGDVPLEASGGELVAKLVVEERVSVLLDLGSFRKHEVATFMTAFLEALYRLKNHELYRTPLMLVIDEADAIAPQKPQANEARMLGAAEDIVRRGGQRGIGCMLVTQRSAVINKNVLTQAQILIALRTIAPQDLAALNAWIDVHGTPEQRHKLMESLPSLPKGEAWVWSPGWPDDDGIFKRIPRCQVETFDSGATPKPGEKRIEPRNPADVDLETLRRQMAATVERQKENDPKALRAELARLRAELAKKPSRAAAGDAKPPKPPRVVEKEVVRDGQIKRLEALADRLLTAAAEIESAARHLVEPLRALAAKPAPAPQALSVTPSPNARQRPAPAHVAAARRASTAETNAESGFVMSSGHRELLEALIQFPDGMTRSRLSILTTLARSTRDRYLQHLRAAGYVDLDGDNVVATDAGRAALPDAAPPATSQELRDRWYAKLPVGQRAILETLVQAYPQTITRDEVGSAIGLARSTRDRYLQYLVAAGVVCDAGYGLVRANANLFDQ